MRRPIDWIIAPIWFPGHYMLRPECTDRRCRFPKNTTGTPPKRIVSRLSRPPLGARQKCASATLPPPPSAGQGAPVVRLGGGGRARARRGHRPTLRPLRTSGSRICEHPMVAYLHIPHIYPDIPWAFTSWGSSTDRFGSPCVPVFTTEAWKCGSQEPRPHCSSHCNRCTWSIAYLLLL